MFLFGRKGASCLCLAWRQVGIGSQGMGLVFFSRVYAYGIISGITGKDSSSYCLRWIRVYCAYFFKGAIIIEIRKLCVPGC